MVSFILTCYRGLYLFPIYEDEINSSCLFFILDQSNTCTA